MLRITYPIAVTFAVLTLAVAQAASAQRRIFPPVMMGYRILDLGTLATGNTGYSWAMGVDKDGRVAGSSTTDSGFVHAFRTAPNTPINRFLDDMGTFYGGENSYAWAINANGIAVGYADYANLRIHPITNHAFFPGSARSVLKDLGSLVDPGEYSYAYGIDDNNRVYGTAFNPGRFREEAVMWDAQGVLIDLQNTLPHALQATWWLADAFAGNVAGQIVGAGQHNGVSHAFLYQHGVNPVRDLGTLPGDLYSEAVAINASGQVVGCSYSFTPFDDGMPVLWTPGRFGIMSTIYLGGLPGYSSNCPTAINNLGQVVGNSHDYTTGVMTCFLWQKGVIVDVNTLLPPGSGWTLTQANGINDKGQIVGTGLINGNGAEHAYLLTP